MQRDSYQCFKSLLKIQALLCLPPISHAQLIPSHPLFSHIWHGVSNRTLVTIQPTTHACIKQTFAFLTGVEDIVFSFCGYACVLERKSGLSSSSLRNWYISIQIKLPGKRTHAASEVLESITPLPYGCSPCSLWNTSCHPCKVQLERGCF